MPSKDMGGMRGSGSMARGMGQYGKGGAKPSASAGSKLSKNKGRPVTSNMMAKSGVKSGDLPKSFSPTNSPMRQSVPAKKSGGKPVRFSDRGDNRLFESQLKKLKNSRGGTFTKTSTTRAVREGRIPLRASPVNSPKQKTSPVKKKGK